MTSEKSLVDVSILLTDLRAAVTYASRTGLLKNKEVIAQLKESSKALESEQLSSEQTHQLSESLNDVAQLIAPISVADLISGRDPFSPENQRRSKVLQLLLSLFALLVLASIGFFMQALQKEQEALQSLNQLHELQPQLKLTALRKMAQWDKPILKESPLYDQYHQKMSELQQLKGRVFAAYTEALGADSIPIIPIGDIFSIFRSNDLVGAAANSQNGDSLQRQSVVPAGGVNDITKNDAKLAQASSPPPRLCVEDSSGNFVLPPDAASLPKWLRTILADSLGDFCFQLNILSPDGDGSLLTAELNNLGFIPHIRSKVSLRVSWFLPFLFGLLGATIFLMRNVASVRTPSMQLFPMVMRLSLGGLAGIVVGWFATSATSNPEITKAVSFPFALAFLTGYGIDVLFGLLDRLNRSIGEALPSN